MFGRECGKVEKKEIQLYAFLSLVQMIPRVYFWVYALHGEHLRQMGNIVEGCHATKPSTGTATAGRAISLIILYLSFCNIKLNSIAAVLCALCPVAFAVVLVFPGGGIR